MTTLGALYKPLLHPSALKHSTNRVVSAPFALLHHYQLQSAPILEHIGRRLGRRSPVICKVSAAARRDEDEEYTCDVERTSMCILQAFNWSTHNRDENGRSFYERLLDHVDEIAKAGFTDVLLPPCCQSLDPQGFLPSDFYNLSSAYGTESELRDLISTLHRKGLRAHAEIVVGQLASVPIDGSTHWRPVGGLVDEAIDWGSWVNLTGVGPLESGLLDEVGGFEDIDHANPVVQNDIKGWLIWLRKDVGFDGWCFDYAKGFDPAAIRIYSEVAEPSFVAADVWNPMRYNGVNVEYNQDQHRQELCNWVKATRSTSAVLDYTTKGVLQQAVGSLEFWRLIDPKGRPPGMIGWWPSKAITFLDNHSTGSEPQHWPFPSWGVMLGYSYILTHPGLPCVFWDHVYDWNLKDALCQLLQIRHRAGITACSEVKILHCSSHLYMAKIGSNIENDNFRGVYMKIGPGMDLGGCEPGPDWVVTFSGEGYCIWEQPPSLGPQG